ncbi:metallophosphoesterase family protein [Roseibacillus persicicus]|uniref:Metallophosphoesterase n=1 Tax=Roseibacillus persicicus TaxID=454148 RepID=A0A918WGB5_9BACT|nr:metallophosphoesterase [Roseibacillus persicicus]GHC42272.1 metallophosphoesterase [Roseibacillus persicicus]
MSFTLLHYSDPHFGASDSRIASAAVRQALTLDPDATVVSGDFSMRGRRREFLAARIWLEELPGSPIVFPGNHDVPAFNNLWERFTAPFQNYRKHLSEEEEPQAELGTLGKIVTVNSCTPFGWHRDWSRGFLSPMQGTHIANSFEGLPPEKLRILGMHHPLLASGEKKRALVSPLPLISNMLQDNQVDLVLAGHFHQSKVGVFPMDNAKRPLVVSQAPSICSTRLKGEPNGFHFLHLSPDEITIEAWQWDGHHFRETSSTRFLKKDEGWQSET